MLGHEDVCPNARPKPGRIFTGDDKAVHPLDRVRAAWLGVSAGSLQGGKRTPRAQAALRTTTKLKQEQDV